MTVMMVKRIMTDKEASALIGERVIQSQPNVPKATVDNPVYILDEDTREIVGILTKLPKDRIKALRKAVQTFEMGTVARMGKSMEGGGRTFGWSPKRVLNRRESCRSTSAAGEYPAEHAVLAELSGWLGEQFRELYPERAAADDTVLRSVRSDWLMDEKSLWTSGVINRSATLPYHKDGMNFHTWSAMPSLRYGMDGGHLHVPEYGITFPVNDGDVSWFCGRDLVHGVTPMLTRKRDGYRYSIVYYAMAGMKDCRTFAEETAAGAERRTAREQQMAETAMLKIKSK